MSSSYGCGVIATAVALVLTISMVAQAATSTPAQVINPFAVSLPTISPPVLRGTVSSSTTAQSLVASLQSPSSSGSTSASTTTAASSNLLETLEAEVISLEAELANLRAAATKMPTSPAESPTSTAFVFTRPLTLGSTGPDVIALQTLLAKEGLFSGSATGYFGPRTQAAVAAFQTHNGLQAVGSVGPKTRALLNASPAESGSPSSTTATPGSSTSTANPTTVLPIVSLSFGGGGEGGGGGGSNTVVLTPDTTPPVITAISSGTPTTTSATITWTTDEAATSKVVYGTTSAYGSATSSASLVTSHSIAVIGLTASSTYHYAVVSTDIVGNTATSSDQRFATASTSSPDTTPPAVNLALPSSGATVSGSSVTLTATASDNVAVANVQFKVDGTNIGSAITSSPYTTAWNSTGAADGTHTLYAVAEDTSGNYATSSIAVSVRNNPPVISAISSGTPTTTAATITWTTDEAATSQVSYGTTTSYGTASSSAALATLHSVALTGLTAGVTYHFQVESVDGQGNTATSSDQTFTTLLPLNSRIVALGDSITAGSVGPSYLWYSNLGGQYYCPYTCNQGVGGNSTDQMLARVASSTALLSGFPGVAIVLGGINDIIGTADTAAQTEANLRAIYNAFEAVGARVIAITILPEGSLTGSQETQREAVNSWIKSQSDVTVIDMDAAGFNASTMTVDLLHPNRTGAMLIGTQVGTVLDSMVVSSPILYQSPSDWGDLLTDNNLAGTSGSLAGGGATGVVATGWSLASNVGGLTVTGSISTDSGGYNEQVVTVTGTSTGNGIVTFYRDQTYSWNAGNIFEGWVDMSVTNASGGGCQQECVSRFL